MAKTKSMLLLIGPDRPTTKHVEGALASEGLAPHSTMETSKGWSKKIDTILAELRAPTLLLIPAGKPRRALLDLTERVVGTGGRVLVWRADDGQRLLSGLLQQRGAIVEESLRTLVQVAQISLFLGSSPLGSPRIKAGRNEISSRLRKALAEQNVSVAAGSKSGNPTLSVGTNGKITLERGRSNRLNMNGPSTISKALALLQQQMPLGGKTSSEDADGLSFTIDNEVVELIVRGPARLLSETTSKRLLAAYGLSTASEKLVGSATEAARVAAEIDGPVVLKLVRPETELKARNGAVITDVHKGADVRRGYHALEALATTLGPPRPLGVLVAEHVSSGARIWVTSRRNETLGTLLILGPGDSPDESDSRALTVPATRAQARAAVAAVLPKESPKKLDALSRALGRLSIMLHSHADMITRAEIHPLVATDGGPALALDALVAIGDSV